MAVADLNDNGLLIATVIIYIIFFISLIIIINEIINITNFCYKYTYLYNYGNLNEKTCNNDDSTSIIEYEKARFRIYSIINNYKLKNDLFNKNWINFISYIGILLLTIIICIGFGILFKYYFVDNNPECTATDDKNPSFLKQIILCFFSDYSKFIPNCSINYCMIFIIIVIFPLIYFFKVFFKLDYTPAGGYWTKINHTIFFILLLYYAIVLFRINTDNKYTKLSIYLSYVIIFYIANYVFNYSYDEYNQPYKMSNIYDTEDDTKKRKSSLVIQNDKNDTMFFDIYKQSAPTKPLMPEILLSPPKDKDGNNLLTTFKYLTAKEIEFGQRIAATLAAGFMTWRNDIDLNILAINICDYLVKGGDIYIAISTYYHPLLSYTTSPNGDGKRTIVHHILYCMYMQLKNTQAILTDDQLKFYIVNADKAAGRTDVAIPDSTTSTLAINDISRPLTKDYIILWYKIIYKYVMETKSSTDNIPPHYNSSATDQNFKDKITNGKTLFLTEYNNRLTKITEYYKAKKDYEDKLEIYNKKYNNYKNTQIDFPKLIFILYDICPKLLGLDKSIVIMIIVAIICYIIIYALLKRYDEKDSDYLYNTIFIYLIGIITVIIINNSVLTYNTYFNKYLIYEPIVQYKYDLNNLNTIFNIALDNTPSSIYSKDQFYKLTTDTKNIINITETGNTPTNTIPEIINEIKNNILTNATTTIGTKTESDDANIAIFNRITTTPKLTNALITDTVSISILRRILYSVLYSASIDLSLSSTTPPTTVLIYQPPTAITAVVYRPLYIQHTFFYNTNFNTLYTPTANDYYNLIANNSIIATNLRDVSLTIPTMPADAEHITSIVKTFFLMIKKTFINDISRLNYKINKIKNTLKYIIYTESEILRVCKTIAATTTTPAKTIEQVFYTDFLSNIDFTEDDLNNKINNAQDNNVIEQYKNNIKEIDDIFNIYEEYVLEFRRTIIELFNTVGYCDTTAVIDIDQKLNDYYRKVFIRNRNVSDDNYLAFRFKTRQDEPLINIYQTGLLTAMKKVNNLFVKYFNIIKFLARNQLKVSSSSNFNQDNIKKEIINNYNIFNKDNNKYTDNNLIPLNFKLQCNYMNKFNKFTIKDKTEQENNMTNVSWSFIILIIIFAIILLEPTII